MVRVQGDGAGSCHVLTELFDQSAPSTTSVVILSVGFFNCGLLNENVLKNVLYSTEVQKLCCLCGTDTMKVAVQ